MARFFLCMLLSSLIAGSVRAQGASGESAIAYLFDSTGEVLLVRAGVTNKADSSCMTLCAQDAVILSSGAVARIVFPSQVYELDRVGVYVIEEPAEVAFKPESGESRTLTALRGSGNPLLNGGEANVVLPPAELFAYVKPPVFRHGGGVDVFSPAGVMRSTMPRLAWDGCSNTLYEISIVPAGECPDSETRFPRVQVTDSQTGWDETGWPALERGGLYRLEIRQNGRLLTGPDASFFVLEAEQADQLDAVLASKPSDAPSGSFRLFMEAATLMNRKWSCAAEARFLVAELVAREPDNPVYLRMLYRCLISLRLEKQAAEVMKTLNGG